MCRDIKRASFLWLYSMWYFVRTCLTWSWPVAGMSHGLDGMPVPPQYGYEQLVSADDTGKWVDDRNYLLNDYALGCLYGIEFIWTSLARWRCRHRHHWSLDMTCRRRQLAKGLISVLIYCGLLLVTSLRWSEYQLFNNVSYSVLSYQWWWTRMLNSSTVTKHGMKSTLLDYTSCTNRCGLRVYGTLFSSKHIIQAHAW